MILLHTHTHKQPWAGAENLPSVDKVKEVSWRPQMSRCKRSVYSCDATVY